MRWFPFIVVLRSSDDMKRTPVGSGHGTMNGTHEDKDIQSEIDEIIRNEQTLLALQNHGEAWAGSVYEGVDHDILAETALVTAFQEIVRIEGEDAALQRLDALRDRIVSGEFEPDLIRH